MHYEFIHQLTTVSSGLVVVTSLLSTRLNSLMGVSLPIYTMPATVLPTFPHWILSLVNRGLQTTLMLMMDTNQKGSLTCSLIQLLLRLSLQKQAW